MGEEAVTIAGGQKATLIGHSMGASVILYMLSVLGDHWVKEHVGEVVLVAPAHVGSPCMLPNLAHVSCIPPPLGTSTAPYPKTPSWGILTRAWVTSVDLGLAWLRRCQRWWVERHRIHRTMSLLRPRTRVTPSQISANSSRMPPLSFRAVSCPRSSGQASRRSTARSRHQLCPHTSFMVTRLTLFPVWSTVAVTSLSRV